MPTLDGNDYTLASGWVWSLASPDAQKQKLSTELAEFLSDSEFMARWTAAAGYLPTRASALACWKDAGIQALASQVLQSAQLYPAGRFAQQPRPCPGESNRRGAETGEYAAKSCRSSDAKPNRPLISGWYNTAS